jgi:dipeptidyl aminopeptidase/acylaminoacyl peptidase
MADLDERFRSLARTPAPDLWRDIDEREPGHAPGPAAGRRIAAAAVALLVATAGVGVAVNAFLIIEDVPKPLALARNGKIAFVVDVESDDYVYGTQADIYVMEPDGSDRAPLIEGPDYEAFPAWAPDGARISFSRGGLFVADADGSNVRQILEDGTGATSPSWSPDGSQIVFESGLGHEETGSGNRDLFVIEAAGGQPERLTSDAARDGWPAWSPDGSQVAFVRYQSNSNTDIYLTSLSGDGARQLTDGGAIDLRPAWSPDGTRLAFEREGDVYVMDADGSHLANLTDHPSSDLSPAWSPDGSKIAFQTDRDGNWEIYVMDADGTDVTRLTATDVAEEDPTWQQVLVDEPDVTLPPDTGEAAFPAPFVPRVTGAIPVEFGGSMVFAYDSLWATVSANDGSGRGSLLRIDPATNEVVARIPDAAFSGWVAGGGGLAAGEGSIWATGGGELPDGRWVALLQRIDPDSNRVVASVVLDEGEWSQGQDVTVGGGGVWVVLRADEEEARDVVVRIDPATNEVVARIPLDLQWAHWIAATEDRVIVLEHRTFGDGARAGVFTTIDARTNEIVASVEPDLLGGAWGLVPLADDILTSAGGWDLARVDPISGDVVSLPIVLGVSAEGLAVGEGGVWFVGYNPNSSNERPLTINRLNPDSGVVDVSAEIHRRGSAIAAGGGAVWIMTPDGILRIDLEPAPSQPVPEALEPFVAPMVAAFMEARIEGAGAENHLPSEGAEAWSTGGGLQPLYSPTGLRYESFAITSVENLGDGTFEVGVRMFGAHLDGEDEWFTEPLFEETLFVGPGRDPNGDPRLLLVTGGRPGLEGP